MFNCFLKWEPEDINLTYVSHKPKKSTFKTFNHFKREFENKLPVCAAAKSHELSAEVYLIEFRAVRIVRKHTAVNNNVMGTINTSTAYTIYNTST